MMMALSREMVEGEMDKVQSYGDGNPLEFSAQVSGALVKKENS